MPGPGCAVQIKTGGKLQQSLRFDPRADTEGKEGGVGRKGHTGTDAR